MYVAVAISTFSLPPSLLYILLLKIYVIYKKDVEEWFRCLVLSGSPYLVPHEHELMHYLAT